MERRIKERLIGAAVLAMLAVIFIPMILDDSVENDITITETNIPARPETDFHSRIVPLQEEVTVEPEAVEIGVVQAEDTRVVLVDKKELPLPAEEVRPVAESVISPSVAEETIESKPVGVTAWVVQLGSFSTEANAKGLNERLRKAGFPAFVEPVRQKTGSMLYRVRVGPELLRSDAQTLKDKLVPILKMEGVDGMIVRYP